MSKEEKRFKEKMEINRTLTMLKKQIALGENQQKDYIEKAKAAKLKGNTALYNNIRTMIKTIIVQTRRLEIMQMNIEFAMNQQQFLETNKKFVKSMHTLGKALSDTIKVKDFSKANESLEKSMNKVNESLGYLDTMLENNNNLFDSVSDNGVSDNEIDSIIDNLIDSEAVNAESSIDDKLDKLFNETEEGKKKRLP